jgi:nucleoside-diphosphate-sugar epimerase
VNRQQPPSHGYGAPTRLPADESAQCDPLSPHAAAKLAGELHLSAYARMYGMAPICLALANVYGPRENARGIGVVAVEGIQCTIRWLRATLKPEPSALICA